MKMGRQNVKLFLTVPLDLDLKPGDHSAASSTVFAGCSTTSE